jgi:hypothetical protein
VFSRAGSGWKQAAVLTVSGVSSDDFGGAAAISGRTILVAADGQDGGRVYVFARAGAGWKQTAVLRGSDVTPLTESGGDDFGRSVAVSGATAVVGDDQHDKAAGRAYVFTRTSAGWRQAAVLTASDTRPGDEFGAAVAVSGTTVLVGAADHGDLAGRAYVFARGRAGWRQVAELAGSDTRRGDAFGAAVSIWGDLAVVGASSYYRGGMRGRAYVFDRTGKGWRQAAELSGSGVQTFYQADEFGDSVGIYGHDVIVGDPGASGSTGYAYFYASTRSGWKQTALLKGPVTYGQFATSVGIWRGTAVVTDLGHGKILGTAYVFTTW